MESPGNLLGSSNQENEGLSMVIDSEVFMQPFRYEIHYSRNFSTYVTLKKECIARMITRSAVLTQTIKDAKNQGLYRIPLIFPDMDNQKRKIIITKGNCADHSDITVSRLMAAIHRVNCIEEIGISPIVQNLILPTEVPQFFKYLMGAGFQFQRQFIHDFYECLKKDDFKNVSENNIAKKIIEKRNLTEKISALRQTLKGLINFSETEIDGLFLLCGLYMDYSQYCSKFWRRNRRIPENFKYFVLNFGEDLYTAHEIVKVCEFSNEAVTEKLLAIRSYSPLDISYFDTPVKHQNETWNKSVRGAK